MIVGGWFFTVRLNQNASEFPPAAGECIQGSSGRSEKIIVPKQFVFTDIIAVFETI